MKNETLFDLDRLISDLQQIISHDRKRIGLFVGAGGPFSIKVPKKNGANGETEPLSPDVKTLTNLILEKLTVSEKEVISKLQSEFKEDEYIEDILTRIRKLSEAIGDSKVHNFTGNEYRLLADKICKLIGKLVNAKLPMGNNPYTNLISWIGGTNRTYPVEIFTPNYDLLFEEAFERENLPYFDGFIGTSKPFFDPTSVSNEELPPRWARIWKLHGSLGWKLANKKNIIRTGRKGDTELIYPDHLKYKKIESLPFSTYFDRLNSFLLNPDSLLIVSGFSFNDEHIVSTINKALNTNKHTSVINFQFGNLDSNKSAKDLALRNLNFSTYASDRAIIQKKVGKWNISNKNESERDAIRNTYWNEISDNKFLLGDFTNLAYFLKYSQLRVDNQPFY